METGSSIEAARPWARVAPRRRRVTTLHLGATLFWTAVRGAVAAVVNASDLAVATSGAYARGAHVVDPHTGKAPAGILSVTITGPDLGTADAYATAAFAMGRDALHWVARLPRGYEGMLIFADRRVLSTPAFPSASTSASTAAA
jgi:thiamine biosynthesis lipoprotein